MLFAGGIGTVLMFWGVAEPISHFANPPRPDVDPFTVDAADDAMGFAIYHLGLHTWAIFTLPGLAFAYFIYRYDLPMRFSSVFYSLIGDRIYGPVGKALDVFAILGTLFGVAVSIGLGTQQINAGLTELLGVPDSVTTRVIIIVVLTTVAVCSIVAGLDKGIKMLSNVNIGMAVGLMLFVLVTGSTVFLLRSLVETFGLYITNLLPMAFWNDALAQYTHEEGGWGWQGAGPSSTGPGQSPGHPLSVFLWRAYPGGARFASLSSGCCLRRPSSRWCGLPFSAGQPWKSTALERRLVPHLAPRREPCLRRWRRAFPWQCSRSSTISRLPP